MTVNIEQYMDSGEELTALLPEKMEVSRLQHESDILLLKGLRKLDGILDTPEDQTTTVKTVTAITTIARYVEQRRQSEQAAEAGAINFMGSGLSIGEEEEDV